VGKKASRRVKQDACRLWSYHKPRNIHEISGLQECIVRKVHKMSQQRAVSI
jgi:hypothetical protein